MICSSSESKQIFATSCLGSSLERFLFHVLRFLTTPVILLIQEEGKDEMQTSILVASHAEEELEVTKKMEITTKVVVMGADVGESQTDIPKENQQLLKDSGESNPATIKEGEENGKAMDIKGQGEFSKHTSDGDQEEPLQRRNLQPAGSKDQNTDGDFEVSNALKEEEPGHEEGVSDLAARRNLVPGGAEDGIEGDHSEFTKPSDKNNVTKTKDFNENPLITEETLVKHDDEDDEDELPWAMYRNIESNYRASDAEDEFSADDESTFDGRPLILV